jgi:hypothetical protein
MLLKINLYHFKKLNILLNKKDVSSTDRSLVNYYNSIGNVYSTTGEHSKALPFCQRAVGIRQKSSPANHPNLQWYKNNLDLVKKKL